MQRTDGAIDPIRKSAFRRFPTLFALLVGFGAGATFFGVERIITEFSWLNERPWLILVVGLVTLALTGRLHKKLE
jgi:uncharacterized membrane protein HdeD (DUF308 family)